MLGRRPREMRCCVAAEPVAEQSLMPTASSKTERPRVSMVSLGCPKNTVDGEVMLGDLFRNGFDVVGGDDAHEGSDAIIINTCGFVEDAKTESLEAIMAASALNADGKKRKIIVTGCLAQRYSDQLAQDLPEADLVLGFENYSNLGPSLRSALGLEKVSSDEYLQRSRVQVGDATVAFRPEWDRHRLTPKHTAYLR